MPISRASSPDHGVFVRRWVVVAAVAAFALVAAVAAWALATRTAAPEQVEVAYYVAPDGDDANPGTESEPWRSIQHAAGQAVPGSTVFVRGGTYRERVDVLVSGSARQARSSSGTTLANARSSTARVWRCRVTSAA